MKKKLNYIKNNTFKKYFLKIFTIGILSLFLSGCLLLIKRDCLLIEKPIKAITSKISEKIVTFTYSNNKLTNNVIKGKNKWLKKENDELKKILNLKVNNDNYVASTVINHIPNFWYNKLEIIAKSEFNINAPVINDKGLVGFITKKERNFCEVSLLTNVSYENMIPVSINESSSGMLSGYNRSKNLFKITNVITQNIIKDGDLVYYKDYKNSNYNGLYIGKVTDVKKDNYGLTKTLQVEPSVNFNDLLYVLVVVDK